jgi:hypothetical protein
LKRRAEVLTNKIEVSPVSQFIEKYNNTFSMKVFGMPHLATRSMHTIIGLRLSGVIIHFDGSECDCRDSSIIMQDSGTGKKGAIEFVEQVAEGLGFDYRRRSTITSAGAIGTLDIQETIDETSCKVKKPVVVEGDLKNLPLLTCDEADSIFYARADNFGSDLLTNLCDSQDTHNKISKRMAHGEVPTFESHTSLFFTTTVPASINPRWFTKGLFQRFGIAIKTVELQEYCDIRDQIIRSAGNFLDPAPKIAELVNDLKSMPIPTDFHISPTIREEILTYCYKLDQTLRDFHDTTLEKKAKTFTNRRDIKMVVYACHHAFLDKRDYLDSSDTLYAFGVSAESWRDILNFLSQAKKVPSCSNSILDLMSDLKARSTLEIREALSQWTETNVRTNLSILTHKKELERIDRDLYRKKES